MTYGSLGCDRDASASTTKRGVYQYLSVVDQRLQVVGKDVKARVIGRLPADVMDSDRTRETSIDEDTERSGVRLIVEPIRKAPRGTFGQRTFPPVGLVAQTTDVLELLAPYRSALRPAYKVRDGEVELGRWRELSSHAADRSNR